jgi:hypothetical protein
MELLYLAAMEGLAMCPKHPEPKFTRFVEFFVQLFSRSCTIREIDSADLIQVLKLGSRRRPLGITSYGFPEPKRVALPVSNPKPHGGTYQISGVLKLDRLEVRRIAPGLKAAPALLAGPKLVSPVSVSTIPGTIATSTVTSTARPRGSSESSIVVAERPTG